jgi:hypothetical protein
MSTKVVTIKIDNTSTEYTYCENFWSKFCDCCGCCCLACFEYFTCIFFNIFGILSCPLSCPFGFCEGACSMPGCCSDKYEAGRWNSEHNKICVNTHLKYGHKILLEVFCTMYANIGRNFGSLIHPYRFHRCLCPKKQVME